MCPNEISIPNIVLTKGESSDVYEIYSKEPLSDFTASFRITNSEKDIIKEQDLCKTPEIKNDDSIYNDHLTYTLEGIEYDNINGIQQYRTTSPVFNHKIRINALEKKELEEALAFTGLVYDTEIVDTIKKKDEILPDEEEFIYKEYTDEVTHEVMVILRKEEEKGIPNCEVTITFTSIEKETSRAIKVFTNIDGTFSDSIFLGNTIKQVNGAGFIFSIPSEVTESIDAGRYVVTVIVKKINALDQVEFCKEVIQTKLDINEKL